MSITAVRVRVGETWHTLTYNADARLWEAEISVPGTSYHQPGGRWNLAVEASNDTGQTATADGGDFPALLLDVDERTAPNLAAVSPPAGQPVTTSTPAFVLTATDSGSGVDLSTLQIALSGAAVTDYTTETIDGGYRVRFTPPAALPEGSATLTVSVMDYDGNRAALATTYHVDTLPPQLLMRWIGGAVVDTETYAFGGTALDAGSPPVTVTLTQNGAETPLTRDPGGNFAAEVSLAIGPNTLTVRATDSAGNATDATWTVYRLITDRTADDPERVRALLARGMDDWTADEAAWFSGGVLRGSYDVSDLVRVSGAAALLGGLLGVAVAPFAAQAETDWLTPTEGAAFLAGPAAIAGAVADMEDLPPLPADMDAIIWWEANNMEALLCRANDRVDRRTALLWGSGEVGCGEL